MIKKYIGPSELHNVRYWQHSHVCYQLYFTIRTLQFSLAFASTYSHCRALRVARQYHCVVIISLAPLL